MRKLDKPDRTRIERVLKSFLLSAEELVEPKAEAKAAMEKNKMQERV